MGHYFMRGVGIFFPKINEARRHNLRAFCIYRSLSGLLHPHPLPVTTVPVIAPGAMVPMTCRPGASCPWPAPVAVSPVVAATAPYPVAVDPDIAVSGRHGAGVNNIGRLVADIAINRTARRSETACYSND